uniref:C-type lectin domain-containing protein n=1 Tax=Timema shepardi TaxID=629360 RepID=A0A7R9AYG7_TIMSH|nr:unnamed protein product [Timema shepardi]
MGIRGILMVLLGVFVDLLLCRAVDSSPMEQECATLSPRSMKLFITSRRNQTGHWLSQVSLEHGADLEDERRKETGIWDLEVEHRTDTCGGVETVQILANLVAPPTRAGPNYELVPEQGYYKFHTLGHTWEEARKACAQEGAHLAIINNEAEAKLVQQMFNQNPKKQNVSHSDFAMIGFHDRFVEGQYITIFGYPLESTGFTRWSHPGQPDNGNLGTDPDSDCGGIHINGGLNDVPCHWRLAFICEQEMW